MHNPKHKRNKLQTSSQIYIFVGYNEQNKVYKMFNHDKKIIEINKNVKFNERNFGLKKKTIRDKRPMEINDFYSAPKSEKIATFEVSTSIIKHFRIPFDGSRR